MTPIYRSRASAPVAFSRSARPTHSSPFYRSICQGARAIGLALILAWLLIPAAAQTATNNDELLRQALHQAINGGSTVPTVQRTQATFASPATQPASAAPLVAAADPPAVVPLPGPGPAIRTNRPFQRLLTNNPAATGTAPAPAPNNPAVPAVTPTATAPAAATLPAGITNVAAPGATIAGSSAEDIIPAGVIDFKAVDVNEVLKIYAELVNRTILRPTTLPGIITLRTQTPLTKKEAIQALDSVLALNGVSVIPVGDKFAKVVPVAQANQTGASIKFDLDGGKTNIDFSQMPELGSYVTHVVQLKYVKPSEMVQVLTPFASTVPNPILPIDASQILVLRDNTENVKRMLELISKIDVAVPAEYISEVIPIKYALASDIANALNSLSTGGGATSVGRGATGGGGRTSGFGGRGGFGTGMGGTSGGAYPGVGGAYPGAYNQPGVTGTGTTTAAPGATGGTFSDRLRNIIQRAGGGTGEIQVLGQTKMIADERTNSLLIFASRSDMEMIKKIISQLDVVLAQVLIEAVIIEVTLGPDSRDFGFSYVQHPKNFIGNITGEGGGGAGQFLSRGFTSGGGGGTNAAAALGGGFNYLTTFGQDLDVTVTALESSSRAKVLQRPRIQTSHAVQAQLFVGESRPYPTGSYYGGASFGGYASIQQLQIGVTLDVTPLINPDGLVVMDIHQTIENYAGFTEISGVGQVPNTTRKEAAAKVAVRDRDTIMLGGLIETDKSKSGSGVPFLMDVPLLGYLFRSSSTSETRKELIVLIRPTVLPTPEVAALTAKAEKDRMPGVRRAEKEILEEEAARLKQADKQLKD